MTDCSELFEVAYKWILPVPKRDLRALCALQSVPGSTKQRKKNKKKGQTLAEGDTSIPPTGTQSQPQLPAQGLPAQATPTPIPLVPIPPPQPGMPEWTSRNPGFAQYHQYVWQIQQQNPNIASSDEAFNTIMQKLQANPPLQPPAPPAPPEIILPPPQFNLGPPPPTLLPSKKEIPLAPKPSPPAAQPNPSPPAQPTSTPRRQSGAFKFCSTKKKWVSLPPTPTPTYEQLAPQWRDQFSTLFYRSPVSLSQSQVRIAPAPARTAVPPPPMLGPFRPLPPESGL